MAMSKRRWLCTLKMVGKIFAYDTFISALPAFFIIAIPEVITIKPLFFIAIADLIIITYINLGVFIEYYLSLRKNKKQYFTYTLLFFALYAALCMSLCTKNYVIGIYLNLPLGLFNYFNAPLIVLILIFFIPTLGTIILAPYMRNFINYLYSNKHDDYEEF